MKRTTTCCAAPARPDRHCPRPAAQVVGTGAARGQRTVTPRVLLTGTTKPSARGVLVTPAVLDGGSEDQAIAALPHDAVEDAPEGQGGALLAEIRLGFGAAVADIV